MPKCVFDGTKDGWMDRWMNHILAKQMYNCQTIITMNVHKNVCVCVCVQPCLKGFFHSPFVPSSSRGIRLPVTNLIQRSCVTGREVVEDAQPCTC